MSQTTNQYIYIFSIIVINYITIIIYILPNILGITIIRSERGESSIFSAFPSGYFSKVQWLFSIEKHSCVAMAPHLPPHYDTFIQ